MSVLNDVEKFLATAEACRHKAELIEAEPEVDSEVVAEVDAVLRMVAEVHIASGVAAA